MESTKVPDVTFKTRVRRSGNYVWRDLTTRDIFAEKRIVLFALPGAFTPTCSSIHLPGYERLYDKFRGLGIDEVICLSVNDAFTMFHWGNNLNISKVFLLPDGNGDFTKALGMLVEKRNLGFGERSWRYSMYVKNGTIEKVFIEPGIEDNCESDPFEVSSAETLLEYLKTQNEPVSRDRADASDNPV